MSIRTKILEKGKIIQEQLIRVLISFDERITVLEGGEAGEITDISNLKEAVGDSKSGLVKDVTDIKTAIGTSTSGSETGFYKDIADINTAIGTSTSGSETGFYKDIVDINTAIGDESTEGTILGRIKALESKVNTEEEPPSG